jgi:hypothetical protein
MNPSFAARLAGYTARHALDDARTAEALGVPIYTARKWINGTRAPNAAAVRLLDVLETLEAMAPALHGAFLPPELGHVKKSRSKRSIGLPDDPVMSKNPV